MRWSPVIALTVAAGCASLPGIERLDPEDQLTQALAALERQDFTSAYNQFTQVYERHWNEPVGQRALLAMAAVEMDPRNRERRLYVGADLAARSLQLPDAPAWSIPVSQTLYLLAAELGAAEERTARAEAEKEEAERKAVQAEREKEQTEAEKQSVEAEARRAKAQARQSQAEAARAKAEAKQAKARPAPKPRSLPKLPGPSVTARTQELRNERDKLANEAQVLRKRLAEREEEIERMRETLTSKPRNE
jgi:chemotaxis protein histidine kinase CheA